MKGFFSCPNALFCSLKVNEYQELQVRIIRGFSGNQFENTEWMVSHECTNTFIEEQKFYISTHQVRLKLEYSHWLFSEEEVWVSGGLVSASEWNWEFFRIVIK